MDSLSTNMMTLNRISATPFGMELNCSASICVFESRGIVPEMDGFALRGVVRQSFCFLCWRWEREGETEKEVLCSLNIYLNIPCALLVYRC